MNDLPNLPIVFEDAHVLVVCKPPEVHVHPTKLSLHELTLVDMLRNTRPDLTHLHPAHRIDRATAGLVVFGKHKEAASVLGKSLANGDWQKGYWLVTRGWVEKEGLIDFPLEARAKKSEQLVSAQTSFVCLKHFEIPYAVDRFPTERYSLVQANPLTGRQHQLRKHFRKLAHPLVGDVKYGHGKHNFFFRSTVKCHGLLLWARSLVVPHPFPNSESNVALTLDSSLFCPEHFQKALDFLTPYETQWGALL